MNALPLDQIQKDQLLKQKKDQRQMEELAENKAHTLSTGNSSRMIPS